MEQAWIDALIGGILIGASTSILLALNGRVTGISGIVAGLLSPQKGETQWRWFLLLGLLMGGIILLLLRPESFSAPEGTPYWRLTLAGLLVGFGTLLGNGCTSGHGVCGISRLSARSIVATLAFIGAGVLTVYFVRYFGGL